MDIRKLSQVGTRVVDSKRSAGRTTLRKVADSKIAAKPRVTRIQDSAKSIRAKKVADARSQKMAQLRAKRVADSKIFSLKKRIQDSESTEECVEVVTTALQEGEVNPAQAIQATIEVLGAAVDQLEGAIEGAKEEEGAEEEVVDSARRARLARARRVSDARRRMAMRNRRVSDSKSSRRVIRRR